MNHIASQTDQYAELREALSAYAPQTPVDESEELAEPKNESRPLRLAIVGRLTAGGAARYALGAGEAIRSRRDQFQTR